MFSSSASFSAADVYLTHFAKNHKEHYVSLEQVAGHNDSSEDDCEVNDSGERKISKDYANEMHIEQDNTMDDTVNYQDNTDAKSGSDSIFDDGSDKDMTAAVAKGLQMVGEQNGA